MKQRYKKQNKTKKTKNKIKKIIRIFKISVHSERSISRAENIQIVSFSEGENPHRKGKGGVLNMKTTSDDETLLQEIQVECSTSLLPLLPCPQIQSLNLIYLVKSSVLKLFRLYKNT